MVGSVPGARCSQREPRTHSKCLTLAAMFDSDELVAFVATTDLDRATAFYQGTLGLTLVERSDFACVFDVTGTTLRVTKVPNSVTSNGTVLGWRVDNIDARVRELVAAGVTCARYEWMDQDENGVWTTPSGDRVAWFTDPDGNILSVTQHASHTE